MKVWLIKHDGRLLQADCTLHELFYFKPKIGVLRTYYLYTIKYIYSLTAEDKLRKTIYYESLKNE